MTISTLLHNAIAYRTLRKNYGYTPAWARALTPFCTVILGPVEDGQETWETPVIPIYSITSGNLAQWRYSFVETAQFVAAATNLEMTGGV